MYSMQRIPNSFYESEFRIRIKKHVIYLNSVAFAFHFSEMLTPTAKYKRASLLIELQISQVAQA